MLAFDTSFGLHLWLTTVPASVPRARERIEYLVNQIEEARETIVIPTPCLAEMLARAGEAGPTILRQIERSARFKIVPFDTRAAVEIAQFMGGYLPRSEKRGKHTGSWAKFKFDHQILAIAKVEGASSLYTDDADLGKLAVAAGIRSIALKDICAPPSQPGLFAVAAPVGESRQLRAASAAAEPDGD